MRPIFLPYVSIADMLTQTFGSDCEVVLHDLNDPEHSVVYVFQRHRDRAQAR